ncbi:MAG: hypothetical protein ACRYFT_04235 [Janthinobacterium lividum]
MFKILRSFVLILIICATGFAQIPQNYSQLKSFQQTLSMVGVQFFSPKEFREIKPLRYENIQVDYAMELQNGNFQVWYLARSSQQEQAKIKVSEDDIRRLTVHPDSLYTMAAASTAVRLAGKDKDNYTYKILPPDALSSFRADNGVSYQLNLKDRPETNRYQYGLLVCLQKNGQGYVQMLFLSNENGPDFYKKVNKAYYSVRFN